MTVALISLLDFESFSIRLLHRVLENNGVDVKSIFLKSKLGETITDKEMKILIDHLKSIKPSFIGISLRSRYYSIACRITDEIKKEINAPIVWGGIHPTIDPDNCIKHADIICRGEGEGAIVELAEKMEKKQDYTKILNLWVKKGNQIHKNPLRPLIENLDTVPFTDFTDNNKVYISEDKITSRMDDIKSSTIEFKYCYPIMTSRGCLYSCTYCCNSYLRSLYKGNGKYTRRRSVKNVIEELKIAKENFKSLNGVTFGDDVFAFDYEWLKDFTVEYKKHINLPFFNMINPKLVTDKNLKLLKDCGLTNVHMGVQSGSERIRKEYYYRFDTNEEIIAAMKLLKKYKFNVGCDLILRNVFETEKDREETMELMLSLPKPFILHCFCMSYFPNYEFSRMALEHGLITEDELMNNIPYEKQTFGEQFDTKRPKDLLFWESIYRLATFKYLPHALTRKLSKSQYLRDNPKWLIKLDKTLINLRIINRVANYTRKNILHPKMVYSKIQQKLSKSHIPA